MTKFMVINLVIFFVDAYLVHLVPPTTMSLDLYLRALDASFRDQDGPSMARYLGADAGEDPSTGFVAYLKEVCVCVCVCVCGAATAACAVR